MIRKILAFYLMCCKKSLFKFKSIYVIKIVRSTQFVFKY